jgi:hypothetical protein
MGVTVEAFALPAGWYIDSAGRLLEDDYYYWNKGGC